MLGIFDLGITSKNGYMIKECGIFDLGITSKNVFNDFFFLFFQFIILDAIIFLLFLLNEKFCHLISEHPFVLIQSIHEWTECICIGMYWEFSVCRNLLCGFLVIEVLVVSVICAGKFTFFVFFVICCVAQNHKQKHTKRISCGHFNEIKLHVKLSIYA